jgi:hypothetical protein
LPCVVKAPTNDAREAYQAAWRHIDQQGLRHPKGRVSHTAWIVDDVLHVLDVWDSQDDVQHWMQTLAPILEDSNTELAGQPETGELLRIVQPD